MVRSLLRRVRRPEYTGEQRCWPCTVVNAALVLVLAALAGLVLPLAGLAVLAVGAALVALRGYAVPYTPQFAPRLVGPLPVSFGHGPRSGGDRPSDELAGDEADADRLLSVLLEAGVLVVDAAEGGEERLQVSARFADQWTEGMARLRALDDEGLAAAVADAAPFEATGRTDDRGVALEGEDRFAWLTRARAIADAAAVEAMGEYGVPRDDRAPAARPLRLFVPECPTTGGPVVETTYANCCGGSTSVYRNIERRVLACEGTDDVLYEFE